MVTVPPYSPSLQRPVHHVVPPTEDYLRSFRPYHTAEDLRMSSLPPLGLDPAAYYHPSYLAHHPFPHPAFRWASPSWGWGGPVGSGGGGTSPGGWGGGSLIPGGRVGCTEGILGLSKRPPGRRQPLSCLGSLPGVGIGGSSPHPALSIPVFSRMDESYCLSALRSPFYPLPAPGSLPPLHPSAMHLHLSGVRYPPELSHSSLSALQSERISSLAAERYGGTMAGGTTAGAPQGVRTGVWALFGGSFG